MRFRTKIPVLFVLAACLTACPGSYQRRLNVALSGLNAARDGFLIYDDRAQQQIVSQADPAKPEEATAALAAYRAKRDKVTHCFVIAYSALTVAALDLSEKSLAEAMAQAVVLYGEIKALMGGGK